MFNASAAPNAPKMQDDVNTIMETIARFLSKISIPSQVSQKPEPLDLGQATLVEDPYFVGYAAYDVPVLEQPELPSGKDLAQLPGQNPVLLTGNDRQEVAGVDFPLLPPGAAHEVQIQLGETELVGTFPDEIYAQLSSLEPRQLETLRQAIERPAISLADDGDVIDVEAIEIAIDGEQRFYQDESGQVLRNEFQSEAVAVQDVAHDLQTDVQPEASQEPPRLEVLTASEAEIATGQQLGDNHTVHDQTLIQAAPVVALRDRSGHIKVSSAMQATFEQSEDEVEAEVEEQQTEAQTSEAKPLTPAAIAVIAAVQSHLQQSGASQLAGKDYSFYRNDEQMQIVANDAPEQEITIQNNQITSAIAPPDYAALMQRFDQAYLAMEPQQQRSPQHQAQLEN